MAQAMVLSVVQSRTASGTRRTVMLNNVADESRHTVEIFYDLIGDTRAPEPYLLDGFVCGIVLYAMRLGQNIEVRGRMSRDCLRNLDEFQSAWCLWKPSVYKKVSVRPDELIAYVEQKGDAIAAFSGGVDSTFTLVRHSNDRLGPAGYPLKKAMLVHGFDVPLSEPAQFDALKERVSPLVKELGFELCTIATNSKDLFLQDWADSFISQLAACIHNYSHEFSYGLVAAANAYNAIVLPWGSTAATDHLLSGSALRVVHEGAGYSRTQKVEELAKFPTAMKTLKSCWEGKETFKNCGRCEKCIRTLLNFKAVGVSDPACFDAPLDIALINSIHISNDAQFAELKSIVAYATAKNLHGDWLDALKARVRRYERSSDVLDKFVTLVLMAKNGQWQEIKEKIGKRLVAYRTIRGFTG
jgi:hypothetical protein